MEMNERVRWGTKRWSKEELEVLKNIAPYIHKISYEELDALFPLRSLHGIRKKLRELGFETSSKDRVNMELYRKLMERIEI